MTTKEEVYRLYKDYVQSYREWSRRVGLKERDFSTEITRIANIFYDFDGGEFSGAFREWAYSFIDKLERYAKQFGIDIGRDVNGKHVLLTAALSTNDTKYHVNGLGRLGYEMFADIGDDTVDFEQMGLHYLRKSRLREVTEEDWNDIAQSLRNGLVYLEIDLMNKLSNIDTVMNNIEHKIKTEALTDCMEYMRPLVEYHYDNAAELYEKLVELQPQNEYIRKLHETLFVDGFDTFYRFMIEKEHSIHPLLVITYNLKKNIALVENDGLDY
jgi:hypothetical protein